MSRVLDCVTHVVLSCPAQTDDQRLFVFSINADAFKRQLNRFLLCPHLISKYFQTRNPTFMLLAEGIEKAVPFITRNFSRAHITSHSSRKSRAALRSPKAPHVEVVQVPVLVKVDDCVKLFGKTSIKVMITDIH